MATTTPNFGWPVPTSTDLVKDGATAIEALGDSIDASLLDLKGGTTGQVLAKASGTDMDFSWVAQDDSNAIQNTIVDAKGDLIAASAADTPARLAVGNNGETLIADSTASTGLKWAKSPNFVGCALISSYVTTANNTATKIAFDGEIFDTDGFHSNSTNNTRITIPTGLGGKYLINMNLKYYANATGNRYLILLKNNTTSYEVITYTPSGNYTSAAASIILDLTAGDYLEWQAFQSSGGTLELLLRTIEQPWSIQYLGA